MNEGEELFLKNARANVKKEKLNVAELIEKFQRYLKYDITQVDAFEESFYRLESESQSYGFEFRRNNLSEQYRNMLARIGIESRKISAILNVVNENPDDIFSMNDSYKKIDGISSVITRAAHVITGVKTALDSYDEDNNTYLGNQISQKLYDALNEAKKAKIQKEIDEESSKKFSFTDRLKKRHKVSDAKLENLRLQMALVDAKAANPCTEKFSDLITMATTFLVTENDGTIEPKPDADPTLIELSGLVTRLITDYEIDEKKLKRLAFARVTEPGDFTELPIKEQIGIYEIKNKRLTEIISREKNKEMPPVIYDRSGDLLKSLQETEKMLNDYVQYGIFEEEEKETKTGITQADE